MAQISFTILITYLQTISTYIEIVTAKYPPTYYILAEVVVVAAVAASVLAIGKRVRVIIKWVTLQPYILLQVGVLIKKKVSVGGRSVVV